MKNEQMNVKDYMQSVGRQAREASRAMARASMNAKNQALLLMAAAIASRARFLALVEALAMSREAARAWRPRACM